MTVNQVRGFSPHNGTVELLSKDLATVKSLKKDSVACKLILLIIIGLFGLSICFICAGQRNLILRATYQTQDALSFQCPSLKDSDSFRLHYPKPISYDRDECSCTPVHYFVILSMQRSGSGWFETLLNNHPNISSHGEIFSGRERPKNLSSIVRKLDEVYNLDYRSSAAKNECTAAVGFKWMLNQGVMEYHKDIVLYFKTRGVSVIFLLRRNLLRRLISILANAYDREMKLLNGTHKSHVHTKEEAETLASYRPTINNEVLLASFHRILEVTENAVQIFNTTRHTILYYEELVKNRKTLDKVQEFLGVSPTMLVSQQVKIHTRPLSEQIENWESVYNSLKGTEFEDFLMQNEYS